MGGFEIYSQLVVSSSQPQRLAGTDSETARIDEVHRPVDVSASMQRQPRSKADKVI